jgi:hypothetical protein
MKKIFSYAMLLLAGASVFTSCKDDNESNPTLTQPTKFVLNEPEVGTGLVDLAKSDSIKLTWSQPTPYNNFNSPVVPTYSIQLSPTNSFTKEFNENLEDNTGADFITLNETYNKGNIEIPCELIDKAMMQLNGWDETTVPATLSLAVRIKSAIRDASFKEYYTIYSNVVTLNTIPYYLELKAADPEFWYLIGSDIADGSWGEAIGTNIIPMQTVEGCEYDKKTGLGEITWTGYLAGNGFKLKKVPNDWEFQWGQGSKFGEFAYKDGGSGDITVDEPGYYTITLSTSKAVKLEDKKVVNNTEDINELNDASKEDAVIQMKKLDTDPQSFSIINIAGTFNSWGDTPMNKVHTFSGAKNHDWYIEYEFKDSDRGDNGNIEIKFKDNTTTWDYNRGGETTEYSKGMYGYGTQGGANIVIPEPGKYLILFNDITGYYHFIKK